MRAIIQRVSEASVTISGTVTSRIGIGFLVLVGIEEADTFEDIEWLSAKIARLRVFSDEEGLMNQSIAQINGECLVVSQFTLHASTKKGNRPSFMKAARPETAVPLYGQFVDQLERDLGKKVATGSFGAMMDVSLINYGPVTIFIDTKNKE
jgi:D-tyrosyl-tRNA(Tyr) deacylase